MRKKYHTLQEMRKALAVRQARWREKNRGYERIRAKSNYLKRRAGGDGAPADSDREEAGEGGAVPDSEALVYGDGVKHRDTSGRAEATGKAETYYGPLEGVDVGYEPMEPKPYGGPRVTEKIKEPSLPETENERRTYAQLEGFKARRAQMEKGVQVELIL